MNPPKPLPARFKWLLGVQLALAVLFFFFFWSQTVSLARGRAASWQDLLALALPALLVVMLGALAIHLWRRGTTGPVGLLVTAPFPLALLLYMALGAI